MIAAKSGTFLFLFLLSTFVCFSQITQQRYYVNRVDVYTASGWRTDTVSAIGNIIVRHDKKKGDSIIFDLSIKGSGYNHFDNKSYKIDRTLKLPESTIYIPNTANRDQYDYIKYLEVQPSSHTIYLCSDDGGLAYHYNKIILN